MIKKTHNNSTDVEREEEECIRDDGWTYQLGECTLTVVGCLVVWLFGCLVVVEEVQDQIQAQVRCSTSSYELIYFWNGRYQSCCYNQPPL